MPAGFHVASAYVDIHAEDAGLRAEIQNAIRGAVAGADPKVKLDVDASALRGKIDAALKEATTGNKGKINLDLDASSLRGKVDAALAEATTANRGKIKLDLDAGDLRGKIDAALAGATAGNRGKIKLDLDAGDLRGKIDAALAGAGTGQKVKVGVDLDTNELRGKISALVAEAGAGQRVHIGVDIDRSALSRAEGSMGNLVRDAERLGGGGGGRGLLGARSGLGSLSVGAVLAGLTAVEPALGALIAPAKALGIASAVLVPAFLGIATGAAALMIGTRGVSTAMKDANKDAVKYGAGLNNLAPAAQDFVKATAGAGGAFTQLRLPVQQALFAGLAQQMQKMGTTALPTITAGLTGMAGLMNTAFKGVTGTLTKLSSGANGGVLGAMFGGLQTAFKPLTAIPGQVVDMLTKISVAASPLLTRITTGIGGAFTGLTGKIDKAFTSGALQSSIDKAGASIGKFFSNFKNNDAVQQMWQNMKTQGPQVAHSLQQIAQAGLHFINNTSGIGTAALKIAGGLANIVNAVPSGVLSPLLTATAGLSLLSKASGGLTKVGTALRSVGQSLGFMGGTSAATTRQATALQGLARSGNAATASLGAGAFNIAAIRARSAAMAESGIAARAMSTRMASAGSVVGTFGANAGTAGTRMAALKYGAVALAATFVAMKGVDSVMGKIFGKPANVTQMAQGFKQFAATGQLTGITAKTLGNNFQKFGSAVQEVAHGGALDKIQNSLARGFAWTGLDAFKDKNKDLVHSVDDTLASLVKSGNGDVASKLFNNLAKGAEKSGTSVAKLKSMFGGYSNAIKDQAAAEKIAAASMGTFGTAAISTQKALAANNGEVQGLQGSLNAIGRFNATATGAQLNYNQAVSAGAGLLKKHSNALSMQNGVLNTTKPAAQAAAGAMLNIAEAAKKSGEAMTAKGDFAQVAKGYDAARASIVALGRAQGLTASQATEFANQIMPTDRAKLYAADIKQTAASMGTLTKAMAAGSAGKTLFNFNPNTFASSARAGLTALGAQVKTLSNGKVQVKVDTVNAQRQVGELTKVMSSLQTKGTQTLKMPTQDVAAMAKAATAMGMSVKNLGGGKIKITAQDGASAVIQGIKSKLDGLKNTKISINAPNIKGADTSVGKSLAASAKGAKSLNDTLVKTPATIQSSVPKVKSLSDSFAKTGKSAKDYSATVQKIFNDPRLQAHGKGISGLGTALSGAATKAKPLGDALSKLGASGKNLQVKVSISGTEQIGKLTALNAVKNKNIQVHVNISGTEQIGKLTALNAVKNKNIQVSVNISGTEQIGKLTALNAVKNKIIQVSVNISGTEQINKLTALNKVNNKSIQVSVNISGAESINKLQALNKVNNKSITVSVHITGADQVTKLKALNQVNNKSVTVSVHVSGADQITKLKALNQVNNKSVTVSVHVSGADQISKLKQLNTVANKHISVSVNIAGNLSQLNQLKSFPSSKHITVTVTANAGPITQIKTALAGMANKTVKVTVTANQGPITQIKTALSGISNKTVKVTVTASLGPVQSLKTAISGIANKSVTITVSAPVGPVSNLKTAISGVQGKSVTVTANVVGLGAVQALISAIAAVQSKTVTVTVNTVKTGSAATGGHMTTRSLAPGFADGGRSYRSAGSVVGPGTGTSDSILARISNGEFIIRASMVKKYGPEFLAGINNGAYNPMGLMKKWGWKLPGFSSGGSSDEPNNDEPNSHVSDSTNSGINYPPYVPGTGSGGGGNVSLSQLYAGAHNDAVLLVQKALHDIYPDFDYSSGPGTFGPQTQKYYSKLQHSMGFQGSDADGIPGIKSLTELMNRTGEYQIKAASTTTNYVIRWGDTLTSIARKFGTSVDALVKLNHIANPDKIYAGNNLKIPGSTTVGSPPPGVVPGTKPGDWNYLALPNFGKLARKQEGTDTKKDVGEVDDITLYTGASTYRDNRFFSNVAGTNGDTIAGQVKDATDVKGLASSLDKIRELGFKAFESGSGRDGLQSYIAQGGKIELQYEKNLLDVNKALEDAKSTQDELNSSYKSLVQSVGEAIQSFATITKVGGAGGSTTTMLSQMTKDAGSVTAFQQGLASLQGRGLNATTMAQIAQTGPTEGLRTVNSLLKATPEQLAQMNALQTQINTASTKIATSAADAMYGAGIQAANGLVQGLQANQAAIQAQMTQIAMAMETALKQALGIASPSKVMFGHGVWTIKGLIEGLKVEGKSIPDVIKAIVDQIEGTAQGQGGTISALAKGGTTGTALAETASGGNVHIGELHVHVDCAGMNITSPDDATKLAKALGPAIMQAIRDENRKRS